jgi:hypothetical protein
LQALALDEDRIAYAAMPWTVAADWPGRVEQMWFAGAHADIGGHVHDTPGARLLANIPFRWIVGRAEESGLRLPEDWRARVPTDPLAPASGNRSGLARLFWNRAPRLIGGCSSEAVHPSVVERMRSLPGYHPRALHRAEAAGASRSSARPPGCAALAAAEPAGKPAAPAAAPPPAGAAPRGPES